MAKKFVSVSTAIGVILVGILARQAARTRRALVELRERAQALGVAGRPGGGPADAVCRLVP